MKDKDLDKLFRDKLHSRDLEFNPANWQAMENILDNRRKALPFYWRTTSAIMGVAALVLLVLLTGRDQAPSQNEFQAPVAEESLKQNENEQDVFTPENEIEDVPVGEKRFSPSSEKASSLDPSVKSLKSKVADRNTSNLTAANEKGVESNTPAGNADIAENILYLDSDSTLARAEYKTLQAMKSHYTAELLDSRYRTFIPSDLKHSWWIQAGPSFTVGQSGSSMATAWFAGLHYENSFHQQWSFSAGLNYYGLNRPDIQLSSDSIFYNFGQEIVRTEISDLRMDYLSLPLEVTYKLHSKHHFSLGMYASWLFNVKREVKQTHFNFKGNAEENTFTLSGASSNFREWDCGVLMAYHFQYNSRTALGLQSQFGFTDLSNGQLQSLEEKHRNISLRLSLKYKLY